MPPSEVLPSYVAYDMKVRVAVQALLSDSEDLPDGLYGELIAFRDRLYLHDLMNMQVREGPSVPTLLADTLRRQIRDAVLKEGMALSVEIIARAYLVNDVHAQLALDALTEEHHVVPDKQAGHPWYVVTGQSAKSESRDSKIAAAG